MSSSALTTPTFQAKIGSIQNQADSSGVYSSGQWSFKNSTALTSVTITDAGNVGIGTASPAVKLHATSAGALTARVENTASVADAIVQVKNTVGSIYMGTDNIGGYLSVDSSRPFVCYTGGAERMRIDASGNLLVGTANGFGARFYVQSATTTQGDFVAGFNSGTTISAVDIYAVSGSGANAAATAVKLGRNSSTLRSLNAGGTVNASGADYAEYMTKAGDFTIAKGDICGINAEGKLTKAFSEAVAFVVKSTNPSYVGGDNWGADLEAGSEELEAARQLVDRIAFCGQVPVNVLGATPGQWIIPVEDNGGIKGEAVSSPSFEQYQKAVGKVIAVEEDGRARIIVKIA